jgi:cephalosporin hydroxylase
VTDEHIVDEFHKLYYNRQVWLDTHWLGIPVLKTPLDLWQLQEILVETQPDLIIETGSYHGGSALFMASVCDLIGSGRIISIDLEEVSRRAHPRVTWYCGSSVAADTIQDVTQQADRRRTMVVLDSDHQRDHVMAELDAYAPLMTAGCYLLVEDTNVNGRPVALEHGPGPAEALAKWLPDHPEFERDGRRERFLLTFNPGGWLRRCE